MGVNYMNLIAPDLPSRMTVPPESDTIPIADDIEFFAGDCDLGNVLGRVQFS